MILFCIGDVSMIEQARDFIISQVDDPALANLKIDAKIKRHVQRSKTLVCKFKKIGDLYQYIKRFGTHPAPGQDSVYDGLKALGLKAYEDIVPEFEKRFQNHFGEVTTLENFVIGKSYSSWDIAIFSRTYDCRSGIYLIGKAPDYQAIFVKATLDGGKYPNQWIIHEEELKYYMNSRKGDFNPEYKVNKAIIQSGNIPIYVFKKNDVQCTLMGIFRYMEHLAEPDGIKMVSFEKS